MADSSAGEETSDAVMEDSLPSDPSLVASPGATGVPPPPPHSAGAAPLDGDMPVEPNAAPIPGIGLDSGAFADIGCNPEADMELATDLFHQESGQDGMHENALEKLIHTDFFNSFRDDFDDSDMS